MSREIHRQFYRSKGFSDHTDAGTDHPSSDGRCWWCWRPVLRTQHDFRACHAAMFVLVTHYKRQPRPDPEHVDDGGLLDLGGEA